MLWCIMSELSLCIGLVLIILYGLFSLSMISKDTPSLKDNHSLVANLGASQSTLVFGYPKQTSLGMVNLFLSDVYFFSRMWPLMLLLGYIVEFPLLSDVSLGIGSDSLYNQTSISALPTDTLLQSKSNPYNNGIDVLLIVLTVVIMQSFKTFESVLLLLLAFVGQLFMLHSCDLVSFYICLEAQNFCFLVLCGLQPRVLKYSSTSLVGVFQKQGFGVYTSQVATGMGVAPLCCVSLREAKPTDRVAFSDLFTQALRDNNTTQAGDLFTQKSQARRPLAGVEASIKYLLLSAFSSGVLLFWFSALYLRTGITTLSWGPLTSTAFDSNMHTFMDIIPQMIILIALMFKLGGAPLHLWMVDIYSGVKRQLLMYLSTAPKLSLFGFWVSTWHSVWTDFTVLLFVALSMVLGCFGAYHQPTLRSLFAYSTINEIGLMLMAIETAGFHSLFQHLSIYIVTMLLLWNLNDKRLFALLAVSLAGMPPLAGFFGKAWIFNSVATGALAGPYLGILLISLFCTGLSLVYYLRVFRLFSMNTLTNSKNIIYSAGIDGSVGLVHNMNVETRTYSSGTLDMSYKLTSFCVVFLIFAPLFYIKPFVL
jgi:NADH:ubiquinone oxidoreductase subunit 2 (subunit N)